MNKRRQFMMSAMIIVGFLVGLLFSGCTQETEVFLETYGTEKESEHQEIHEIDTTIESVTEGETLLEEEPSLLYVYVCGAVAKPGVYTLSEGSRIYEAIEMAGGLLENADVNLLNQAELLLDGQMIRVYTYEEVQQEGLDSGTVVDMQPEQKVAGQDDRININTATKSELMTLPGIGSAKADAIITYREEHGSFSDVEDLMYIPGIKEGIFLQIEELIRTN